MLCISSLISLFTANNLLQKINKNKKANLPQTPYKKKKKIKYKQKQKKVKILC